MTLNPIVFNPQISQITSIFASYWVKFLYTRRDLPQNTYKPDFLARHAIVMFSCDASLTALYVGRDIASITGIPAIAAFWTSSQLIREERIKRQALQSVLSRKSLPIVLSRALCRPTSSEIDKSSKSEL